MLHCDGRPLRAFGNVLMYFCMISEVTGGDASLWLGLVSFTGCLGASVADCSGVGARTEHFDRRRYDGPHVEHDHVLLDGCTYHTAVVRPVHIQDSVAVGILFQRLETTSTVTSHHQVIVGWILLAAVLL